MKRGATRSGTASSLQRSATFEERLLELSTKLENHQWKENIKEEDRVYVQKWMRHEPRLRRFLISCNTVDDAFESLKKVAADRTKHDLWGLHYKELSETVKNGLKTGAFYSQGVSKEGYPIIWQTNRRLDCRLAEKERIRAVVLVLDSLEAKMDDGQFDKRRWIIVMDQAGSPAYGSPSLSFSKTLVGMTTKFYPELMYKVYIIDAGTIPHLIFSFMKPFLGEGAQQNIKFVKRPRKSSISRASSSSSISGGKASALENMVELIGAEAVPDDIGGCSGFEWNGEQHWESIVLLKEPLVPDEADPLNVLEPAGKKGRRWSRGLVRSAAAMKSTAAASATTLKNTAKPVLKRIPSKSREKLSAASSAASTPQTEHGASHLQGPPQLTKEKSQDSLAHSSSSDGRTQNAGVPPTKLGPGQHVRERGSGTCCTRNDEREGGSRYSSKQKNLLTSNNTPPDSQEKPRVEDDVFSLYSFQTVQSNDYSAPFASPSAPNAVPSSTVAMRTDRCVSPLQGFLDSQDVAFQLRINRSIEILFRGSNLKTTPQLYRWQYLRTSV
ncbi:unnamed protein product [Amoebophrya sp. A120]|nr:unnamed protein product [Amoebophrya sp. A120]|eukprot:GSA120T00005231001.1